MSEDIPICEVGMELDGGASEELKIVRESKGGKSASEIANEWESIY
jgi:hypothetical protein